MIQTSKEERLGTLISDIYRQWRTALDNTMPQNGLKLTRMQWQLIGKLRCRGPILSQQALACHMVIDQAQLTRLLRPLEDKGIIRKTTDAHDRRIKHIELLNPEDEAIESMMHCARSLGQKALQSLSETEQTALLSALETINQAMDQCDATHTPTEIGTGT